MKQKLLLWPNFCTAVLKHNFGSGPTLTRSKAEAGYRMTAEAHAVLLEGEGEMGN